jgi:multicomponent Na+:H+ antiporter subunit E
MPQIEVSKAVSILTRITLFAGLWWIIAQGRTDAWLIGLPAAILAAMASISLSSDALPRLSIIGLFRFIALFISESINGGIDVARRTLSPKVRVQPGFSRYHPTLDDPHARVLFINCISLLPGTLSTSIHGDYVELHLLDMHQDPVPQLQRIEQVIASMFRLRPGNTNA